MGLALGVGIGTVLALYVIALGVRRIVRGRRELRTPGSEAEERMVASFRVAKGVRMINAGLMLMVLVAIAAYVWGR